MLFFGLSWELQPISSSANWVRFYNRWRHFFTNWQYSFEEQNSWGGESMNKAKVFYIISIFLLLTIFSNRLYNIGDPSFLVPVIIIALGIGVIGVYLFGKEMKLYKNLHFISYVITVGFAFVPVLGVYIEDGNRSYGFPAQWFSYYYINGSVSIHFSGFLFNYFIFYFILRFLNKMLLRFSKDGKIE